MINYGQLKYRVPDISQSLPVVKVMLPEFLDIAPITTTIVTGAFSCVMLTESCLKNPQTTQVL